MNTPFLKNQNNLSLFITYSTSPLINKLNTNILYHTYSNSVSFFGENSEKI